ncbi:MAG TPA: MBL fold metallo-hydrolase [Thermodesulfobacteriota bacterium]|nr:MBL fold metallo-hydrolase [Thermodesulfobacteriota bacterium]
MSKQLRSSGGLWLSLEGANLYMDPGPGALVRCLSSQPRLNPTQLDGILLSHKHLDHSGDINAMIEAMTEGGYRPKGTLFAPSDALEGDAVVLRYIHSYLDRIEVLGENTSYTVGNLKFSTAAKHLHSVETFGFNFQAGSIAVSYITDTKYHPGLLDQYPGEVLILNVVLLTEIPQRHIEHLSVEDVLVIVKESKARAVVMTHFGTRVLEAGPAKVAERLAKESGKTVIAAEDGMVLNVDELVL